MLQEKFWLLSGLYVTQFLGLGFILTAVPAIMRENGASLDQIGVIYLLGLIWAIKFLWAPLIDRYGSKKHGHYRIWLIILQSLMIVFLVGASFFDINGQMSVLALFFAAISFASATQDIAADALGVTILAPEERGLGNSIQTAGGFLGNMIGGGVVLIAYQWLGWQMSLLILAAGTALPLLNILRHKEQPAPADARDEKVGYRELIRFFRRPGMLRWIPILLTYTLGISAGYAMINPMLVDLGWSLDRIGFATNIVGSIVSIAGAAGIGLLMQRIGRKSAMIIANIMMAFSIAALFPAATGNDSTAVIYGSICLMLLGYGAGSTVLATMIMDKSDPSSAGTDYTLQFSLMQIVSFGLSGATFAIAEAMGYSAVLWGAIVLSLVGALLVYFYNDFEATTFEQAASLEPALGD